MSSSTEEFERYRLEVEALNGHHSQHVYDPVSKKSTWQVWMRKRPLGHGAFGEVQQEMWYDDSGDIHYRAVKICSEARMKSAQIDYKRELSALAAFSKSEVFNLNMRVRITLTSLSIQDISSICMDGG